MIKAIIFDCFDVLVGDATKPRARALDELDPQKAEEFRSVVYAYDKGILADKEANKLQAALLGITTEALLKEKQIGEVRNEPLIAYVATLKEHFKVGMLSNIGSRAYLDAKFLPGQLDALFDVVVASGDIGYIKPQPEIFEHIAAELGVEPSECIMIDDVEQNCDGARAAGMHAIQFKTNSQCITDLNTLIDRGKKTD